MNWAPPTIDAPPPTDESETERRGLSAVPAATWIALLGSALILFAAVAVVASNWDTIGQSFRVAGLALATGVLLVGAERTRRVVPATASIVAHVGTYLVPFVGIAVMSLFGFTWPTCLAVGGAALIVTTHVQAERWRRVTMHLAQVAGFALAATGLAALTGTTGGLIAIVGAVGLLVVGAQRRSVGLSMLAVFSPVLTALADAGIGAGTLERAGLVGERLSWSGPAVGLIAATIIGAVALQRRSNPLMLFAVASPVIGLVTGLAAIDGSDVAWWTVPALAVIAAELGWYLLPTDRFRSTIGEWITFFAGTLAVIAWFGPALVQFDLFDSGLAFPWAIPTVITGLAIALATLRWHTLDSRAVDLGIAAGLATAIATLIAFDTPSVVGSIAAVAATALAAFLSRRLGPVAIHATALWALAAIIDIDAVSVIEIAGSLSLLVALVGIVVGTRARLAATNTVVGWAEMSVIACATTGAALAIVPGHGPAAALVAVTVVAVLSAMIARSLTIWAVAAIGTAGAIALDTATATIPMDATYWVGWAAAAAALTALWAIHRSPIASFAAGVAATFAGAAAIGATGVSPEDFTVMAMLATTALTGLAFTMQRRSPLDASAIAAGFLLLVTTGFPLDPVWVSGVWVVLGLQLATYGAIMRLDPLRLGGVSLAAVATASWWFTTDLNDWFLSVIEPADIRVADLWLAAASLVALVAGVTLRSTMQANSWVAYTASLVIPGLWLTSVHVDRATVWALPLLLTIGVGAAAVGAWQRLAAPLVGGTLLTAAGVFLATGSDLTNVPTWIWLALGGSTLLGTAVLIERAGKPGSAALRELVNRWN